MPAHSRPSMAGRGLLLAAAAAIMMLAALIAPAAAHPDNPWPGSFMWYAKENKSPLITSAYPLHRAVAFWDLAGAAIETNDVNQAVTYQLTDTSKPFGYTPLAVAMQNPEHCGYDCSLYPEKITDIIHHLLCSGANVNTPVWGKGGTAIETAAMQRNGGYALAYALLLSGASKETATFAFKNVMCGHKQTEDQIAALTSAVLLAFGADGAEWSKAKLDKGGPFIGARPWKDGQCVKPAANRGTGDWCYSTCKVLAEGLTADEAAGLRAGRVTPALATRLDVTADFVGQANAAMAKAAAAIKACPAKKG